MGIVSERFGSNRKGGARAHSTERLVRATPVAVLQGRVQEWHAYLATITILILLGASAGLSAHVTSVAGSIVEQMGVFGSVPWDSASAGASVWITAVLKGFFFIYVLAVLFPFLTFLTFRLGWRHSVPTLCQTPLVSIIVPAFNEQENISRAMESIAKQSYPNLEVIYVNDGSTDFSKYIFEKQGCKLLDQKQNRGKANALNEAVRNAKGSILVFSDSDSFLHQDAVRNLVVNFQDPRVGAVAGRVEPIHAGSLIGLYQECEYVFGQAIVKPSQMVSANSIMVCPGPVCAFRRDVLLSFGGFKARTLTEDFDATFDVLRSGYQTVYEPNALAFSRCPQTWSELKRQRVRWSRGCLQLFGVHADLFLRRRFGLIGLFWLPYYLLSGWGNLVLDGIAIAALPFLFMASDGPDANLAAGLVCLAVIEALSAALMTVSLVVAKRAHPRLLLAALGLKPYTIFMAYTRLLALVEELRSTNRRW